MPELKTISVERLHPSPFQPREAFDKALIEELGISMENSDLLQPIIVRPHKDGYQIACGERRWRAAKAVGWKDIPEVIKEIDDRSMLLYSLVENLHRVDLESSEKEKGVYELWKEYYEPAKKKYDDLAKELGRSATWVRDLIDAHEARGRIRSATVRAAVNTEDLKRTRGPEEPGAKELLEKKVRGDIAAREMEDIATVAKEAPREKQKAMMDQVAKEARKARELVAVAKEEAVEFAKGQERPQLRLGADENRLRRFAEVSKDIRSYFTVANIEMIKNETFRWKAVDVLEKTREYCDRVLRQLQTRKWYKD